MFKAVNYLLYEKNKDGLDVELLESFNHLITMRTFSYYDSGTYCNFINDTLNVYSGIFKTKEEQFKFFDNVIPKLSRKRSEYIKKSKTIEPTNTSTHIPEFLSKRELDFYQTLNK